MALSQQMPAESTAFVPFISSRSDEWFVFDHHSKIGDVLLRCARKFVPPKYDIFLFHGDVGR